MANQNKEVVNKKKIEQPSVNEQIQEIYPNLSSNEGRNLQQNTIKLQSFRKKLELLQKTSPKSTEEISKLENEIFGLEREKVRLVQFYALKYKWNEKQKTIIWKNEQPETVRASDILFLKKTWADLAKLLLVKKIDATKEVSKDKIEEKDEFIVNFWENQNVNNIIGAWDILGTDIREVEINWVKWFRKSSPRPGYYTEAWKYLPVYDGDSIKIIKKSKIEDLDLKELEDERISGENRFEKLRINDIIESGESTELSEDKQLLKKVEETKKKREEERKKWESYKWERREEFLKTFQDVLKRESEKYNIPQDIVVNLIQKESKFNPKARPPEGSAFWLGQHIDSTWRQVSSFPEFTNIDLDRQNPEHQIMATFAYLNHLRGYKSCSIEDAVIYYHTGPGFKDSNVENALRLNPAIARNMRWAEMTAQNYIKAAKEFYWV